MPEPFTPSLRQAGARRRTDPIGPSGPPARRPAAARRFARAALFTALLAAGPRGGFAAEPAATAEESVVTLPPLLVEEKGRPLQWRYFELPGIEALSLCDDSSAAEFARRLHRLDELLRVLLPERFCARESVPQALLLFNEEAGRARSQEVIREMVEKQGARVDSDGTVVLPHPAQSSDPWAVGATRGQSQRIRFLPNVRMADLDATSVFAIMPETNSPRFTFSPERVEDLLVARAPALPDWFVEGMLGFYRQAELQDDEIIIEPASWLADEESAGLARDSDRPRTLLPMRELLTRPRGQSDTGEMDRVWRAQCALFVRWALVEKNGAQKEALWKFVDRLETEPLSEALFREQFGLGFSDARDRLSDYLPVALNQGLTLVAPKTVPLPRLKFRPATDLEIARIRGDWERMEIGYVRKRYPELTAKYIEQARHTLHRAYDRGERDPRLLAILGLTEIDAENPDGAREFLEAAVRGRIVRPRACFELAYLRYKALPAGGVASLTAEQAAGVLEPLLAARLADPPLPRVYALLAEVWSRSSTPPTSENLALLNEGARLFPQVSAYVLRTIYLNLANGQVAPAVTLTDLGLRHARDPAMRERLERVQVQLTAINK